METLKTGFVFDERMLLHEDVEGTSGIPESPERLKSVVERLVTFNLMTKCFHVESREATKNQLLLCHDEKYLSDLMNNRLETAFGDFFVCDETPLAVVVACGSILALVDAVCEGKLDNAIALIRPGGHHALRNRPMGFCYLAHTAIAMKYASRKHSKRRILIVDWDVHHGNGTQVAIEDEDADDVLFISIQRNFYPFTGFHDNIGKKGNMINICFDKAFGDDEIMTAFHEIVMPVAKEYQPELILVTNGYDAVKEDKTGGCHVSPSTYGVLTSQLMTVQKNVILIGATGYHDEQSSNCAEECVRVLLGSPPTSQYIMDNLHNYTFSNLKHEQHRENIKDVLKIHSSTPKKWKCFEKYKELVVIKKKDTEAEFKKYLVREFGKGSVHARARDKVKQSSLVPPPPPPTQQQQPPQATSSVFYRRRKGKPSGKRE